MPQTYTSAVRNYNPAPSTGEVLVQRQLSAARGTWDVGACETFPDLESARDWIKRQGQVGPGGRPAMLHRYNPAWGIDEVWGNTHWGAGNRLVGEMYYTIIR
jgi:hypothetical protein